MEIQNISPLPLQKMGSNPNETVGITHEVVYQEKQNACDVHMQMAEVNETSQHFVKRMQNKVYQMLSRSASILKKGALLCLLLGYLVYFGFALAYKYDGDSITLIVLSSIVVGYWIYISIKHYFGAYINNSIIKPTSEWIDTNWYWLQWPCFALLLIGLVIYLVGYVITDALQVQSLSGLVFFMGVAAFTSKHPSRIKWRPVLWGLAVQFVMGMLVLRWRPGYLFVKALSDNVTTFLWYCLDGSATVFGDPFFIFHPFAFVVIPLVVWLGTVNAILFHLGIVPWVAKKLSWIMSITLHTTAIESFSIVVNIFLSVVDTMLMLRQYIPKLTQSEFHCFIVGSHATIAGFAFGIFVLFGVSGQHLITGAVMSAPAAVAIAKLNWPETEESQLKSEDDMDIEDEEDINVISAAANGAMAAGESVAIITLQVISFISLYRFANTVVIWFGQRVGIELTLGIIFSYLFFPLALLMGIEYKYISDVANLLGTKLVANEVLAYLDLGRYIREGRFDERTTAIVTYGMCGFSSFGTLAIFVGVWQSVNYQKMAEVAAQTPRILLNANIACFLTACIAGLLYNDDIVQVDTPPTSATADLLSSILGLIPSYKDLMQLV